MKSTMVSEVITTSSRDPNRGKNTPEKQYRILQEHLETMTKQFQLPPFEQDRHSSYRLQIFSINGYRCKVLLSGVVHKPKGTSQEYDFFKRPTGLESIDFVVLLVKSTGAVYVIPSQKLIDSNLGRISIPRAGPRGKPKINFEEYKGERGAALIKDKKQSLAE